MANSPLTSRNSCFIFSCLLMVSRSLFAEADNPNQPLLTLLSGNSIYGHYGEIAFRQYIHSNGQLTVSVKDQQELLQASWLINDEGHYCEQWPDHRTCFLIDQGNDNHLDVKALGKDADIVIKARLYSGQIPMDFNRAVED